MTLPKRRPPARLNILSLSEISRLLNDLSATSTGKELLRALERSRESDPLLDTALDYAKVALKGDDTDLVALLFFLLGQNYGPREDGSPVQGLGDIILSKHHEKNTRGARAHNKKYQNPCREWARAYAREVWKNDKTKDKKIGLVAKEAIDHVKQKIAQIEDTRERYEYEQKSPKGIETYKKYLRDIAPKAAKEAGRPKNK